LPEVLFYLKQKNMMNNEITLGERIATGFISALLMGIMAICVPIAIAVLSKGRGLTMLTVFSTFHIWGATLMLASGIIGMVLGAEKTTSIFAHLWGTESPRRLEITVILWFALFAIGGFSYWLFAMHHIP
jgi:hypothetical protein